jgi:hypothetical protein
MELYYIFFIIMAIICVLTVIFLFVGNVENHKKKYDFMLLLSLIFIILSIIFIIKGQ